MLLLSLKSAKQMPQILFFSVALDSERSQIQFYVWSFIILNLSLIIIILLVLHIKTAESTKSSELLLLHVAAAAGFKWIHKLKQWWRTYKVTLFLSSLFLCQYQSQQSPDPVKSHPPNTLMDFKHKWLTLSPLCPAGPGGPIIPGMP